MSLYEEARRYLRWGVFPHATVTCGTNGRDWPWRSLSSNSPDFALFDQRRTKEEIQELLQHVRPDDDLDDADAKLQLAGMRVQLLPHQARGLAWMEKMEDGSNKGGILADEMGLGKTVQTIALMLKHPPPAGKHRPTLIVMPVALLDQWKFELEKCLAISHVPLVITLHRRDARRCWSDIAAYDIVLNTYGTLASEWKRWLSWQERLTLDPESQETAKEEFPMLSEESRFHRVILDEAHVIKNKSTRVAMAACHLHATYRWCLTGTPLQNRIEELFSLIKFCRIRPYADFGQFSRDFVRPLKSGCNQNSAWAMEKFQALLRAILLRRTKTSTISGEPILQLPSKYEVEERVAFREDQFKFYQALEQQAQIQFNKYLANGKVGRNYSKTLVLLLRLRQCCCSPQLVTNSRDFATSKIFRGTDLLSNARNVPAAVAQRMQEHIDVECPVCMDAVDNPTIFIPCGHAICTDCFCQIADNATAQSNNELSCPHCRAVVDVQKITDLESVQQIWYERDDQAPVMGQIHLHRGIRKSYATKEMFLRRLDKLYQPCAKIEKLVQLLHDIDDRGEAEKTIIFSTFTSFLDLVEVCMRRDPLLQNYVRYDGSMTVLERATALHQFNIDPSCRTILVSIKAGNAGLNLSAANHVVILDPFWNPFLELQAADRCHRIGQQRAVTVHRILIGPPDADENQSHLSVYKSTIEDRIMNLQAKKMHFFESALDEHAGRMVSRLQTRELGYLFGLNELRDE